jgi:two-component system, NtrC family, sensor histidine kinase HydH
MQRFGKVSWILAAGLVTAAVINGALAWLLTETFAQSLLTREVAMSREFLQGIVNAEDNSKSLFAKPAPSPALTRFASFVENLPGVLRANVYSPDRFIRHSTEAQMIGLKFEGNEELEDSFKGGMTATFEEITLDPKPEHLGLNQFAGKQFIEAYVPLNDEAGNTFAVIEYYSDAGDLLAELGRVKWIIAVSELLAGLAMLAALYGLFRRRQ